MEASLLRSVIFCSDSFTYPNLPSSREFARRPLHSRRPPDKLRQPPSRDRHHHDHIQAASPVLPVIRNRVENWHRYVRLLNSHIQPPPPSPYGKHCLMISTAYVIKSCFRVSSAETKQQLHLLFSTPQKKLMEESLFCDLYSNTIVLIGIKRYDNWMFCFFVVIFRSNVVRSHVVTRGITFL